MTQTDKSTLLNSPIGREIMLILAIKISVIVILFLLFFSPAQRPDINHKSVRDHLTLHPPKNGEIK